MGQLGRSLAAAAVVLVVLVSAAPAQAQATVVPFSETSTATFEAGLDSCPQDSILSGTITLTQTSTGQVVETPGDVFTIRGVRDIEYRLEQSDGMYIESGPSREHFVFVANPPHTVSLSVSQDSRTIYAADGTPVGTLSIHAVLLIMFTDLNGDLVFDPGEITTQFSYFRLRCG